MNCSLSKLWPKTCSSQLLATQTEGPGTQSFWSLVAQTLTTWTRWERKNLQQQVAELSLVWQFLCGTCRFRSNSDELRLLGASQQAEAPQKQQKVPSLHLRASSYWRQTIVVWEGGDSRRGWSAVGGREYMPGPSRVGRMAGLHFRTLCGCAAHGRVDLGCWLQVR